VGSGWLEISGKKKCRSVGCQKGGPEGRQGGVGEVAKFLPEVTRRVAGVSCAEDSGSGVM